MVNNSKSFAYSFLSIYW